MKLDHIGVAVTNLEEACTLYRKMGFEVSAPEVLSERKLKLCMVDIGGGANVELLFPTDPESAIAKFIEKKGPGIHHLCYRVDDLAKKISELKAAGLKVLDEAPKPGAHNTLVAFVHPGSVGGVLTEFCQHK